MKRLILVRHAKTEPLSSAIDDFERKLKPRGNKDALLMAKHLNEKNIRPEIIISSPAFRAIQTARLFADIYGIDSDQIVEARFVYDGFSVQSLIKEVERIAEDRDSVMVVGHNPDIAMAAIQLTNDDFFHFPTAAVAALSFSVGTWDAIKNGIGRTNLFLSPKELKQK